MELKRALHHWQKCWAQHTRSSQRGSSFRADESLAFATPPIEALFMFKISQTCVQCSKYLGDYWGRGCDLAHLDYLSTATFGNLDAQHSVAWVVQ
jgi:hypothetical protein